MNYTREELTKLSRKELQKLCKQNDLKASKKNSGLIDDLVEYYLKEECDLKNSLKKESDVEDESLEDDTQKDDTEEVSNYTQEEPVENIIEVEESVINYKQEVEGDCETNNVEEDCETNNVEEESCDLPQHNSRKRPLEEDQINETERETKKTKIVDDAPLLKLLIPNYAAGALIGKGGTNISEMQNRFGGTVRLSSNKEYYPGTDERIVVISGEIDEIIDLNKHVMEKVQEDSHKQRTGQARGEQVKMILTNAAAGLLIGHGGLTIKAIQKESEAKISISSRERSYVPGERMLSMSGSMDQLLIGCRLVIEKIADEVSNVRNRGLKYANIVMGVSESIAFNKMQQYSNPLYPALSYMSGLSGAQSMGSISSIGMGSPLKQKVTSKLKTNVKIEIEVPDHIVGAILGKQGQTINEFIHFSGAKIKVSGKNEFVPGTSDRILTITGDNNQSQTAYFLINQKVKQALSELSNH